MCSFHVQGWKCCSSTFLPPRMVTFRKRCDTHRRWVNLVILVKMNIFHKMSFHLKLWKLVKIAEIAKMILKHLKHMVLLLFSPLGGKCSYVKTQVLMWKAKCKNIIIYVQHVSCRKSENQRFLQHSHGPIFSCKYGVPRFSLKLYYFHYNSLNSWIQWNS